MAISDVQQDARFNQGFAQSTGYVPRSILAMPLVRGDRVIGVMEVLDKISAPAFGMQDMELLGLFAQQAAIAIDQSRQAESIRAVVLRGLRHLADDETAEIFRALEEEPIETDTMRDLLALADLFNTIGQLGDTERQTCVQILSAFGDYARSKSNRYL
jgi:GAF domain-containing protein